MTLDQQEYLIQTLEEAKRLKQRVDAIEAREDLIKADPFINQVMNYPSLEKADGAQPEWWEVEDANITLTEEDATGEGITQIHERVLKAVNGGAGADKYFYQRFVHADQPLWDESVSVMSFGCWVWAVDAGIITLEVFDNGGAVSLDTDVTDEEVGEWVWLEVSDTIIGTTSTDIRFSHSANSATFYVALPVVNPGGSTMPWAPRDIIRREGFASSVVDAVDPGGGGWTDVDITANTTPLTVMAQIVGRYLNTTADGRAIYLRRKGSAEGNTEAATLLRNVNTTRPSFANKTVLLDDGQTFQYDSSAIAGNAEELTLSVAGYWEWE
jgi:hypothetical protein